MSAIHKVIDRYGERQQTVSVGWPAWAVHLGDLMGKISTWAVFVRNPDLREWLEARNADFAAYARDRDLDAQYQADMLRQYVERDDNPAKIRYCRCSNCGSVNIDPIIRTSDEVPV